MKVRVAVICDDRLLSARVEKLIMEEPDLRLVPTAPPPVDARAIIDMRSDVLIVDLRVLRDYMKGVAAGGKSQARLILMAARTEREKADLITKGVVAGIVPADAKGRLLKKAVKAVASGELWLGADP
jgi:chemotaxis response regulator CheB